jgi:hypothetical protein
LRGFGTFSAHLRNSSVGISVIQQKVFCKFPHGSISSPVLRTLRKCSIKNPQENIHKVQRRFKEGSKKILRRF